jgi:hypothetical protein
VLDRGTEKGVCDSRKCTSGVVLAIAQARSAGFMGIDFFELAACVVEGAELDGDAGADADEGGESAFVER